MLTVYTAAHCPVHGRTRELVAQLRLMHPGIPMRLVDMDDSDLDCPAFVVGAPTYAWNGQVIFLGNPSPADLMMELSRMQVI